MVLIDIGKNHYWMKLSTEVTGGYGVVEETACVAPTVRIWKSHPKANGLCYLSLTAFS